MCSFQHLISLVISTDFEGNRWFIVIPVSNMFDFSPQKFSLKIIYLYKSYLSVSEIGA